MVTSAIADAQLLREDPYPMVLVGTPLRGRGASNPLDFDEKTEIIEKSIPSTHRNLCRIITSDNPWKFIEHIDQLAADMFPGVNVTLLCGSDRMADYTRLAATPTTNVGKINVEQIAVRQTNPNAPKPTGIELISATKARKAAAEGDLVHLANLLSPHLSPTYVADIAAKLYPK